MTDFCHDATGPYRLTLRGAHATVVETRAEVVDVLDGLSPNQQRDTIVETPAEGRIVGNTAYAAWIQCEEGGKGR